MLHEVGKIKVLKWVKRYFSVFILDWKNSAVKTSMTKHETATTTNEVCLVNSVLGEAA